MKVCTLCGRDYTDDLGFCLEDGTPLSTTTGSEKITEKKTEQFGERTFSRPSQTVAASARAAPPRSSNKFGIILLIGILLLGLLVLLGAGLAGIWFYISTGKDVAQSNNINGGRNVNGIPITNANMSNSRVGGNVTPTPTSSLSPASNAQVPTPIPTPDRGPTPANKNGNGDPPYAKPDKSPAAPKTISGGMLNAKAISLPRPPYPPAARAVRASGSVSVQVLIDESGNVVSATAVSGHPLLRAAAASAARGAKFSPTLLSGQPVKVSGVITYNFVP